LTSESGDVPVYRTSAPEPWRTVRARIRQELGKNANPGEINDAGYFTAACGITVYRGAAYPPSYHNNLFIAEPAGNLVHRRSLDPQGVTFESRRLDEKAEVIASSDNFFRPVNLVNAPDGTLHVVDMYREVVEDPKYVPDDLIKTGQINLEGGRELGRIYRLSPPNFRVPKPPRLGKAATTELVAQLENPNSWWRETAQRLLYERQDRSAVEPLRKLVSQSSLPQTRLHALWSLEGLDSLQEEDISVALADRSAGVRQHAVRLAEKEFRRHPTLLTKVLALAKDPDPMVRFQVAFTLGEAVAPSTEMALRPQLGQPEPVAGLAQIARKDADDAWIRTAVLSSSVACADHLFETLLQSPAFLPIDGGMILLKELAFTVGSRKQRAEVERVLAAAATADSRLQTSVLVALGEGLRQSHSDLMSRFFSDASSPGYRFNSLFIHAQQVAQDMEAPIGERQDAIALLGYERFEDVEEPLSWLLKAGQPQEVQSAAVAALARHEQREVPAILLRRWRNLSPAVQGAIADALLARREWIHPFLDAVETQTVSGAMIGAGRRTLLLRHSDQSIRDRATALFGTVPSKARDEVIERYKVTLSLSGDRGRGKQVFERSCVPCHRFGGTGNDIGPNLSAYGQASTFPEKLLISTLDPNREVSPEYVAYNVTLKDGSVLTGIIATQTSNSVTLKQVGREGPGIVILRNNIEEMTSSAVSLMPEGFEESINPEEMANLLAFLLAIREGI
jgi:putative heme-binding domain-containing protein